MTTAFPTDTSGIAGTFGPIVRIEPTTPLPDRSVIPSEDPIPEPAAPIDGTEGREGSEGSAGNPRPRRCACASDAPSAASSNAAPTKRRSGFAGYNRTRAPLCPATIEGYRFLPHSVNFGTTQCREALPTCNTWVPDQLCTAFPHGPASASTGKAGSGDIGE